MSHSIFKNNDIDELSKQYRHALDGFNAGTIYFPARIKYLEAIRATLEGLPPARRHLILALNSSVSSQRLSNNDASFNFQQYMAAFRNRAEYGDTVLRIFCMDESAVPTPDRELYRHKQLGGIANVIGQHGLQKCVNRYVRQPAGFNCVFIFPLIGDPIDEDMGVGLSCAPASIKEFLVAYRELLDFNHAVIFREFLDYDPNFSSGCGSRHSPLLDTTIAEDEFDKYVNLAKSSFPVEPANTGCFDFGLIVALPLEYHAIEAEVKDLTKIRSHGGAVFYRGTFTTNSGRKLQLLVALLDSPGNIASGIAATLMVEYYKAEFIVNIGIAGGIRNEVVLGDVVVGHTVLYYESKKVTTSGDKPDFKTLSCRPGATRQTHDPERYLGRVSALRPTEPEVSRSPRASFDGTIASGEKVIGDPSLLETLKDTVSRKTVACDNESAGIYMAVKGLSGGTPVLAVRAISDYADEKKGDDWHKYAACAAAAYIFDFLSSQ